MNPPPKSRPSRLIGILLVLTAVVGMLASAAGVGVVWRMKTPTERKLRENLQLLENLISTTIEGLSVAERSMEAAISGVESIESTLRATARSFQDSSPLVSSLADLMGEQLPSTVEATITSLRAAQASAQIIDAFLLALSQVPLAPDYTSEVPLHVALEEVATSLEGLPADLSALEGSLDDTSTNLVVMNIEIKNLADNVHTITRSLTDAQEVVEQYQEVMADLSAGVDNTQNRLSRWVLNIAWMITGLLLWVGLTQVGLLVQGISLVRG